MVRVDGRRDRVLRQRKLEQRVVGRDVDVGRDAPREVGAHKRAVARRVVLEVRRVRLLGHDAVVLEHVVEAAHDAAADAAVVAHVERRRSEARVARAVDHRLRRERHHRGAARDRRRRLDRRGRHDRVACAALALVAHRRDDALVAPVDLGRRGRVCRQRQLSRWDLRVLVGVDAAAKVPVGSWRDLDTLLRVLPPPPLLAHWQPRGVADLQQRGPQLRGSSAAGGRSPQLVVRQVAPLVHREPVAGVAATVVPLDVSEVPSKGPSPPLALLGAGVPPLVPRLKLLEGGQRERGARQQRR